MSMKNSNGTIGNRSRDLPVCSAVPQPLRHRFPPHLKVVCTYLNMIFLCTAFVVAIIIVINISTASTRLFISYCIMNLTKNSTDTSQHANKKKLVQKQVPIKLDMRTQSGKNKSQHTS
jgi:hypothetical protein